MFHFSRIIRHKNAWRLIVLLIADGVVFIGTNAKSVVAFMLVVGFLLIVATLYQLMQAMLAVIKIYGITVKQPRRLAASLSGLMGGLVALQSIGELSLRDALVLLPLVILGYLYSYYSQTRQKGGYHQP